jgi:hypothetical protein
LRSALAALYRYYALNRRCSRTSAATPNTCPPYARRAHTTGTVAGDPDKPIRIVVESISRRRRQQLADVEAGDAEVEELPPGAT